MRARSLLVSIVIAAAFGLAKAEEKAGTNPADLSKLVAAVERLVNVLEQQARDRSDTKEIERLQVLVSILNIRYRKTDALEDEIRNIESEQENVRSGLANAKARLEAIDQTGGAPGETSPPEYKSFRKITESQVKIMEEQLGKLEDRKVQTQNELASARRRLAHLESILEEWVDKQNAVKP